MAAAVAAAFRRKAASGGEKRGGEKRGRFPFFLGYVRGGPLKNTQIQAVSATQVTYRYYAHADNPEGAKRRPTELTLTPAQFIARYSQHLPEPGRQVVRAYGLYAHIQGERLTQARGKIRQSLWGYAECRDGGPQDKFTEA